MFKNALFLFTLILAFNEPAHAISKCTLPDGKVVFQDTPCNGKGDVLTVRPASGHSQAPVEATPNTATGGTPDKPQTSAQRMTAQAAQLNSKRRIQEYEQVSIPYAQREMLAQRKQCDEQMKELSTRKLAANNNLAGATWEGSISQEMTAVATRCDTKDRQLKDSVESLRKECQALGGCK